MRLLILLILFPFISQGQIIRANPYYRPTAAGVDADYQKFIDSTGITDATQKDAIKTLVRELKDSSLWSSFIAIYPIVGGSANTHKWNLKNPGQYTLTYSGSITHSANGMVSAGGYANMGINPSTDMSQNSNHLSFYSRTQQKAYVYDMGSENGSGVGVRMVMSFFGDNYDYASNTYPGARNFFADNNTNFYEIISRTSSSGYKVYQNAVVKANMTSTSSTPPNVVMYLLTTNLNGTAGAVSGKQCAFATVGSGLTDNQARALNTIVEKFNDALSRGVQ